MFQIERCNEAKKEKKCKNEGNKEKVKRRKNWGEIVSLISSEKLPKEKKIISRPQVKSACKKNSLVYFFEGIKNLFC